MHLRSGYLNTQFTNPLSVPTCTVQNNTPDCYQTKLGSAYLILSKANLLIPGLVMERASNVGQSKKNGQLMLKRLELPDSFQ